jgi:hypothetical protein
MRSVVQVCLAAALIVWSALVLPFQAQQKDCSPPAPLPTSAESNFFSEEQEVFLGDAAAEHIQKN